MNENDLIDEAGSASESPLQIMADHLREIGQGIVLSSGIVHGEIELQVNAGTVAQLLMLVRDDRQAAFTQLIDLTAVDYPERKDRFDVVYQMLSMSNNMRLRIVATVSEGQTVPSVTGVFMAANWAEREVWDMYGVFFTDHLDLRRMLTDYGFEGHPLRKDFPLTGRVEVRYDETQKRVVYDPVKLTQDFRSFDFFSPWEGMNEILPGDEKANADEEEGAEST